MAESRSLMTGSVHTAVAREIGRRILRGDYPPGTALPNEAQWSSTYSVSRSAVREAVKMLMAKGLLNSRPKVGTRVEPRERWNLLDRDILSWYIVSPERRNFLSSVQEIRYIVEPEAAALAAQRRSAEQMTAISQACYEMGHARSIPERADADVRFHLEILRAAGNEFLVPLGFLIESALANEFLLITREVNDLRYAQELHDAIERSIRLQRPEAARRAVRRLLANSDEVIARFAGRLGQAS
jgi:DNA-binding FadR family transcriptional regulator